MTSFFCGSMKVVVIYNTNFLHYEDYWCENHLIDVLKDGLKLCVWCESLLSREFNLTCKFYKLKPKSVGRVQNYEKLCGPLGLAKQKCYMLEPFFLGSMKLPRRNLDV